MGLYNFKILVASALICMHSIALAQPDTEQTDKDKIVSIGQTTQIGEVLITPLNARTSGSCAICAGMRITHVTVKFKSPDRTETVELRTGFAHNFSGVTILAAEHFPDHRARMTSNTPQSEFRFIFSRDIGWEHTQFPKTTNRD